MSDEALAWKFAFGVLVLLFCGVWFVARQEPQPAPARAVAAPVAPALPVVTAPKPLPATSVPPPLQAEPAPADMPEAQEDPVRIRIALREPAVREPTPHATAPHASKAKPRKVVRHAPPAHKLRFVRAPQRPSPSPYAIGRKHYPLDPRDRWHRELAGAY